MCVFDRDWRPTVSVVFGDIRLSNASEHHVSIPVERIYIHPDYDDYFNDADIAVLRLAEPVNFTDYVRPACLSDVLDERRHYTRCLISGWGDTEIGKHDHILQLKGENIY